MGCCFSNHRGNRRIPPAHHRRSPPPPTEEETVKEVLSETPFHATTSPAEPLTPKATPTADRRSPELRPTAAFEVEALKLDDKTTAPPPPELSEEYGDVSEYSELCSAGESFSTATTNTTATLPAERGDVFDDSDVTSRDCRHVARNKRRSSNGCRVPRQKPPPTSKTPLSRPEPPRERSGRRHERSSPAAAATRVAGGARRRPVTRGGMSGGKMVGLNERVGGELGNAAKNVVKDEEIEWEKMKKMTVDESLDNPLVSFECFIFL